MRLRLLNAAFVLWFSIHLLSQNAAQPAVSQSSSRQESSLATAARESKTQKAARAKKIFTDDDVVASTGPFPRLKMAGPDNADLIINEIGKYKQSHTPEQIEAAVQAWYEEYDSELAAAIQDTIDRQTLMRENQANGYELCQQGYDYEKCAKRQMSEASSARQDQNQIMRNYSLIHRVQQAFSKVRNGLARYNLHYDWFKIRTTNNIDSY